jgi:hypothetical protein
LSLYSEASPFEKTAPGEFKLRHPSGGAASAVESTEDDEVESTEDDEEEPALDAESKESARIIHAFGMYWQRDRVMWKSRPKLLGRPNRIRPNSEVEAVDFCNQLGVYFLHDGSEVVYVGRALKRPLGVRLSEHTDDRLNGRWNRFSWFGLLRISDGKVVGDKKSLSTANGSEIIIVMESLLIEGLEPKQNRKRGDNAFQAVEYIQSEDEVAREKERMDLIRQLLAPKPND